MSCRTTTAVQQSNRAHSWTDVCCLQLGGLFFVVRACGPGWLNTMLGECCCSCSTHGLSSNTTALITSNCDVQPVKIFNSWFQKKRGKASMILVFCNNAEMLAVPAPPPPLAISRRRDCHLMAPPCTCISCFNRDKQGVSSK